MCKTNVRTSFQVKHGTVALIRTEIERKIGVAFFMGHPVLFSLVYLAIILWRGKPKEIFDKKWIGTYLTILWHTHYTLPFIGRGGWGETLSHSKLMNQSKQSKCFEGLLWLFEKVLTKLAPGSVKELLTTRITHWLGHTFLFLSIVTVLVYSDWFSTEV